MSYNKDAIYSIVEKYFSLEEGSLELFRERLDNPVIDDVYKSFGLDENGRKYWEIEDSIIEENDSSWGKFNEYYPSFIKQYGVKYTDFRKNIINIDKNNVKMKKALVTYYISNKEVLSFSDNFETGFGCLEEVKKDGIERLYGKYPNFKYYYDINQANTPYEEGFETLYREYVDWIVSRLQAGLGETKFPNKKLYLVLSCNFEDWFFCSTGNGWSSCLNLTSSYGYWAGLPGLITDTNRAILYLTSKEQKKPVPFIDKNIELDKMISRTWVLLDKTNKARVVKFYPSSHISKKAIYEITKNESFKCNPRGYIDSSESKNSFELLFHKGGKSLSTYLDHTSLSYSDDFRATQWFYGGGMQFINKKNTKKYYTESPINNINGGLACLVHGDQQVSDYLRNVENGTECRNCGNYITPEEAYVGSDGNYYCVECFNENFTTCANCGEVILIDDSYYVDGAEIYCSSCFDEFYFTCDICYNNFEKDQKVITADGRTVCLDCAENKFKKCEFCGKIYNSVSHTVDGKACCTSCFIIENGKDLTIATE